MNTDAEIIKSGKCGNSPKNAFVENFTIWLMTADQEKLSEASSPDGLAWLDERQPLIDHLAKMNPTTVTIFEAISHGRVGAACGEFVTPNSVSEFSVFLEFENTKAEKVHRAKVYFAPSEALASG